MAGVDASIYLNQQVPDIMGNVQRGLGMRQQMQQQQRAAQEQQWADQAQKVYGLGMVQNPDGTTSFDPTRVRDGLAGIAGENPYAAKMALDIDNSIYGRNQDASKLKLQQDSAASEERVRQAQIAKMNAETNQLKAKPTDRISKLTEAEKTVDRTFGKDYVDWTAGGSDLAKSEIEKLRAVSKSLGDKKVTTGGMTGFWPDRMTSDEVLKARADVQSTVMNSLRAILGSQFTEKEGERIIKNTWNEADSTENNLARIDRLIDDLDSKAAAKDAQSLYYEGNRTLSGYQPVSKKQSELTQAPGAPTGKKPSWAL